MTDIACFMHCYNDCCWLHYGLAQPNASIKHLRENKQDIVMCAYNQNSIFGGHIHFSIALFVSKFFTDEHNSLQACQDVILHNAACLSNSASSRLIWFSSNACHLVLRERK